MGLLGSKGFLPVFSDLPQPATHLQPVGSWHCSAESEWVLSFDLSALEIQL